MANQDNKNFVNSVVDSQKEMVDTMIENTKKFTNGNTIVNETVQKGTEMYKNWLDSQKNVFTQTTEKTADMTNNMKDNVSKMNEFFQNWFNGQNNWSKQIWEMNTNWFQNAGNTNNAASMNPMNMWNSWTNNINSISQNMNQANNWMNMMNQWNSMFNTDAWKQSGDTMNGVFTQYNELLKDNFAKWQDGIKNGTAQDAYKNMINAAQGFTKFQELWTPMWKSVTEKTFNMDAYKQYMNPAKYKELLDQYFGFMPEGNRQYMDQMMNMMQEGAKQMNGNGMQYFQQMRNMMPAANTSDMFGGLMNGYNTFYNMMSEAYAPFTKMMTPTPQTASMMEWQDIANRIAVYNIKNAELQYMVYNQGSKVMDQLAENIAKKMQSGEEVNSLLSLFQEWMNIGDKTFVTLFEADEYSKLMAEVSAMQLKLRKDIENQMEKMMTGIPVATRSEMDELYKTIYDLKKQVRQMEKMMDLNTEEEPAEEAKTTRRTKKA